MPEGVETVFNEFVAAHARGEAPDPRDNLDRAGAEVQTLGRMLDAYLSSAPGRAPSADVTAMINGWMEGEPTLLTLRISRGRRVADVVQRILDRFGIDPGKRARVQDYYQQLENGTLAPSGVDDGVFTAIATALDVPLSRLAVWGAATRRRRRRDAPSRVVATGRGAPRGHGDGSSAGARRGRSDLRGRVTPVVARRAGDPRAVALRGEYTARFGEPRSAGAHDGIAVDLLGLRVHLVDGLGCSGALYPRERLVLLNEGEARESEGRRASPSPMRSRTGSSTTERTPATLGRTCSAGLPRQRGPA